MSDREDLSRLVALADRARAHNFRPDTEAGRDALAALWSAVDLVRDSAAQGELELGPQGHRYAWCPQCGECSAAQVDEDGCCAECGCTAVGPGIDALVDRYNHELELSARRLVAAKTMRDHARAMLRVLGAVRTSMVFKCLYCGLETEVAADMVAHGETCEKHPAVVRLKGIRELADLLLAALSPATGSPEDPIDLIPGGWDSQVGLAACKLAHAITEDLAKESASKKPEPVKDGAL